MINPSVTLSRWIKIIGEYVSIQAFVQAIGLICGIIVIRNLSKEEYAYFTLANSMQGAMNVLADSGVSSAVAAIGGKVWNNPYQFGQLINTALKCKTYLGLISTIIVSPILYISLINNGAYPIYTIIIIFGVIIELYFYILTGIKLQALKLNSKIKNLQNIDISFVIVRFLLLLLCLAFFNACVAVYISAIASAIRYKLVKNYISKLQININAPLSKKLEKEINKVVIFQAPSTIYYCFSGQLTVLLISFFGKTENIAEFGALSRLAVIFMILSSVVNNIALPSFSRTQNQYQLAKKYLIITTIYVLFSCLLLFLSFAFQDQFIYVIGNKYISARDDLILMVLSVVVSNFVSLLWSLNTSKSWIKSSWILIPLSIIIKIILLFLIDISTVRGIILFSTFSFLPNIFVNLLMSFRGIANQKIIKSS